MRRAIFLIILALILGVTFYIYWMYYNTYGEGNHVGRVTNFVNKGNVFKTYEGELKVDCDQTYNRQTFYFSVTDEAIAAKLQGMEGQCIKLHYTQYRRHLSWRGENYQGKNTSPGQYIVDAVDLAK